MAAQTYFSTNGVQGFPFLHILTNICYLCSFWWQPFWQVWGDISLWFCFAFPWWLARLSIFSWLSAFPLWKNVYSVFLPVVFFFLSCMSCLYILHINPLLVISFANIFSHLVGHLFIDGFQQILSLVRSHLFIFAFFSSYFRRQIQEIFLQFMSKSTLPIFSSRNFLLWYRVLPLGL